MKLILARHGETDWNIQKRIQGSTDIPLNATGLSQANALAQTLCNSNITSIYTSPLIRALTTARLVGNALKLPVIPLKELTEINFGDWEGLCWDEVQTRYPNAFRDWYQNRRYGHPPNGESYQELMERFVPALQNVLKYCPDETGAILVISHSACIMALLSLLNDTPFHEMVKRYSQKNTAIVELDAGRIHDCRLQ